MRRLLIKEEYIKSTGSFIGGIILDYLITLKEENKLDKPFPINLKKLPEETMLDICEITIRKESDINVISHESSKFFVRSVRIMCLDLESIIGLEDFILEKLVHLMRTTLFFLVI